MCVQYVDADVRVSALKAVAVTSHVHADLHTALLLLAATPCSDTAVDSALFAAVDRYCSLHIDPSVVPSGVLQQARHKRVLYQPVHDNQIYTLTIGRAGGTCCSAGQVILMQQRGTSTLSAAEQVQWHLLLPTTHVGSDLPCVGMCACMRLLCAAPALAAVAQAIFGNLALEGVVRKAVVDCVLARLQHTVTAARESEAAGTVRAARLATDLLTPLISCIFALLRVAT